MSVDSKLAKKLASGEFIVTAEFLPKAGFNGDEAILKSLGTSLTAINVADNIHGIGMSSIASSVAVIKSGSEPICQIVTRDRNRIALQSDLLGASYLGIKNLLCLSGYHQTVTGRPESANVYDIDSIQFIEMVNYMSEKGILADGSKITGQFSMLTGAVANPFLKPLELNIMKVAKKAEAGAKFFQTSPIFDIDTFGKWLEAAISEGITSKAAIIASVYCLSSADEAQKLKETYTDYVIPDSIIDRLKKGGSEGINICIETINKLKKTKGLRGIHVLCDSKGKISPEVLAAAAAK